jgi:hypothetical protein
VSYSAHVAPTTGSGTPTGTVTFKVGATTLCTTLALDGSGNGSCSATNAPVGTDTVTATYSGDANFATSSGTTTETVSSAPRPTTTTATATPGSSSPNQSVTYSVNVAPTTGSGVPTGTVTFTTGATFLCTTGLDGSGNGSCSANNAPIGTDTVTATYSGDANFASSTGTTIETVSSGGFGGQSPSQSSSPMLYRPWGATGW